MIATLLVVAPAVVLGACIGLILLIIGTKVTRTRSERRAARLVAPFRGHLLAVSAGEDDDGEHRAALISAPRESREAIDTAIRQLLKKVRGVPADHLIEVLVAHDAPTRALADLTHRSAVRRARGAQLLGLCRVNHSLPALVTVLGDPAAEVRASAAYALGLIGNPAGAKDLLDAVGAERSIPAGPAADALGAMGLGISGALASALNHPSATTRNVAAHVSGDGSFTRSTPLLRSLVSDDPDLTVREAAAQSLSQLGRREDVDVLAWNTTQGHPTEVRRACAQALGDLGEPLAVPHLARLLDDEDPRLAEVAATSLLRLGPTGQAVVAAAPSTPAVETARTMALLQAGHG